MVQRFLEEFDSQVCGQKRQLMDEGQSHVPLGITVELYQNKHINENYELDNMLELHQNKHVNQYKSIR